MSGREVRPVFRQGNWQNADGWRLEHFVRKLLATLQRRMQTTGQKFGRQTFTFPDGTRIIASANMNGPSPVFHANVIPGIVEGVLVSTSYLETGIVAWTDIQACEVEVGTPGNPGELYFNDTLRSWSASRVNSEVFSYIGTLQRDNEIVLTAYPPLPDYPGSVDKQASESEAFGCNRWQKKEIAQSIAPSIFPNDTMRLLVQGKYGRKGGSVVATGSIYSVNLDAKVVSSSATLTHAIYTYETDESIEYWLVELAAGTLKVGQLRVPGWAQVLLDYVKSDNVTGNDRTKIEGWALAHAGWPSEYTTVSTDIPTINPLSYGWRANIKGTEYKAVTVTGSGGEYTFSTQTVNLQLTYDGQGNPEWSVSYSDVNHATDVRFINLIYLWALNANGGYDSIASSNTDTFSAVPVFGWFEGDVWQTEDMSGDSSSGSEPIDWLTRDICNLTWAGVSFKGAKNYSSKGELSSADNFAGVYSYSSSGGNPVPYGTLTGGGDSPETKSGYRTCGSACLPTDFCGDRPDLPDCASDPTGYRYKRQGFKEPLTLQKLFFGGSYSAYNFLVPALGDCNKCYVGTWVYLPEDTPSTSTYERRKYYAYTDFECWDTDIGDWVGTGWTHDQATTALAAWTLLSSDTGDFAHAARELKVRLVGDSGNRVVFNESGTSGTPESRDFGITSSMSGGQGDVIDLRTVFVNGNWGPYITPQEIVFSSLKVRTSAGSKEEVWTPHPGADYDYADSSWSVPNDQQFAFVGWI